MDFLSLLTCTVAVSEAGNCEAAFFAADHSSVGWDHRQRARH